MDLATLVPNLVTFLTPFLPYLLKAGDQAAEEAGKQLGAEGWTRAKALWATLHPKLEARPAAHEIVQDAAQTPNDADTLAALRVQFKKLLVDDPVLASELVQQLDATHAAGATVIASGPSSIAIGGTVTGSMLNTGDHTTMR